MKLDTANAGGRPLPQPLNTGISVTDDGDVWPFVVYHLASLRLGGVTSFIPFVVSCKQAVIVLDVHYTGSSG